MVGRPLAQLNPVFDQSNCQANCYPDRTQLLLWSLALVSLVPNRSTTEIQFSQLLLSDVPVSPVRTALFSSDDRKVQIQNTQILLSKTQSKFESPTFDLKPPGRPGSIRFPLERFQANFRNSKITSKFFARPDPIWPDRQPTRLPTRQESPQNSFLTYQYMNRLFFNCSSRLRNERTL